VAETLSGMTGVAGHPGLVSALSGFTETSTKALLSTGQALTDTLVTVDQPMDQRALAAYVAGILRTGGT
jgi:hypothetical protein